jgi:hypothetical protein
MLSSHRLEDLGFSASPLRGARWRESASSPFLYAREGESIEALDDGALNRGFRCWRGRSGQRYVFSVFEARGCPAYDDAVLIAAVVEDDGTRRAIAFEDTGSLPDALFSRLAGDHAIVGRRLEFHVHLLARTAAERRDVLDDLR